MDAEKDLITINANIDLTTDALKAIVENAKKLVGVNEKGYHRVDTADVVSRMISKFLLEKDFEGYVKDIENMRG